MDPREWFRYHWKLEVLETIWKEFYKARAFRRKLTAGFEWNQIMILGKFGLGKSVIASYIMNQDMRDGHPAFTNASYLPGWRMALEEMYTAMPRVPLASTLLYDEVSGTHNRYMTAGVAVSTASSMNLNTRKRLAKAIYTTAHHKDVSYGILEECQEVWKPVPKADMGIVGKPERTGARPPAMDPENFRFAYYIWGDFPFKKADLTEGKPTDDKYQGLGLPDEVYFDQGEAVRDAFLMTDTFELAMVGAARAADIDVIKEDTSRILAGRNPKSGGMPEDKQQAQLTTLINFFLLDPNPPDHYRPGAIASRLDVDSRVAGSFMQRHFDVPNVQRKGYPREAIMNKIKEYEEVF